VSNCITTAFKKPSAKEYSSNQGINPHYHCLQAKEPSSQGTVQPRNIHPTQSPQDSSSHGIHNEVGATGPTGPTGHDSLQTSRTAAVIIVITSKVIQQRPDPKASRPNTPTPYTTK
jgi:hypothetical protein